MPSATLSVQLAVPVAGSQTSVGLLKAVPPALRYWFVVASFTETATLATPDVASLADPASVVLAPAVELGPRALLIVMVVSGSEPSSVMESVWAATLPAASFTSRQTVLAPSPAAKVKDGDPL